MAGYRPTRPSFLPLHHPCSSSSSSFSNVSPEKKKTRALAVRHILAIQTLNDNAMIAFDNKIRQRSKMKAEGGTGWNCYVQCTYCNIHSDVQFLWARVGDARMLNNMLNGIWSSLWVNVHMGRAISRANRSWYLFRDFSNTIELPIAFVLFLRSAPKHF